MRFACKTAYDGRAFSGSQIQPDTRTVEGVFKEALETLSIDYGDLRAAGRTDKGVSSLGNVFSFTSNSDLVKPRVLNSALPKDVVVLSIVEVDDGFNPRHALHRTYKYFLLDEGFDLQAMNQAGRYLEGRHSFHNFSAEDERDPFRTIKDVGILGVKDMVILTVTGTSFLWQMVRRIVRVLTHVGKGMLEPEEMAEYLDQKVDRKVPPAPPENLVLWEVAYDFRFPKEVYSLNRFKRMIEEDLVNARVRCGQQEELLKEFQLFS